jgi:predicted RNase H-like nuclease (RuvC/YqgF family)
MPATSVGRLRQSAQGVSHVINVGTKVKSASMEMVRETRRKSDTPKLKPFPTETNNLYREMERLQHRNKKIEQKYHQLVNALLNLATELSPAKRRELEGLIMVSVL